MTMNLVVFPPLEPARLAKLREAAAPMRVINAEDAKAALAAAPEADAYFGKITPEILAATRRLRWIQTATASLEHYMFPALVEHPCLLSNMRGLFSDVIADHVFGYILCFARHLHTYIRQQIRGEWSPVGGESGRSNFSAGPGTTTEMDRAHMHLADATLGVVGLGYIGSEIARRGRAFGMRVLAVDPKATAEGADVERVWRPSELHEFLAHVDFVVIAAPHTPDTAKMFRRAQFQAMRRAAYLINIGRGAIVDLTDLVAALDAGELAGAALDVFETEPLPPEHSLWRRENVILTPHVAGVSPRIAERHLAVLLDNVRRFARGEQPVNLVDKASWF